MTQTETNTTPGFTGPLDLPVISTPIPRFFLIGRVVTHHFVEPTRKRTKTKTKTRSNRVFTESFENRSVMICWERFFLTLIYLFPGQKKTELTRLSHFLTPDWCTMMAPRCKMEPMSCMYTRLARSSLAYFLFYTFRSSLCWTFKTPVLELLCYFSKVLGPRAILFETEMPAKIWWCR